MNAAVILAAGSSSRMGFPKQLAEVRDKPLLQAIIDKVNINFDNSSVVLGSENEIISEKIDFKNNFTLPTSFLTKINKNKNIFQPAGETMAWKYLMSFSEERVKNYAYNISKPEKSRVSCSRLSPYISWGNISVRQAYQFVKNHTNYSSNKRAFNGVLTRLKWHCHFIHHIQTVPNLLTDFSHAKTATQSVVFLHLCVTKA